MSRSSALGRVAVTVSNGIAELELCNPAKRNAVTRLMWEELLSHLSRLVESSDEVRVLVVRGAGQHFCAGADLGSMMNRDTAAASDFRDLAIRGIRALAAVPVPTVALIEGSCIGAGCSLALACDMRIAYPSAVFSVPAVRHGIVYDAESIGRLTAVLGPGRAAHFLYTATQLNATDALVSGLVDHCSDDAAAAVADVAESILSADRDAIAATRVLLRTSAIQERHLL